MLEYLETLRGHGRSIYIHDFGYGSPEVQYESHTKTSSIMVKVTGSTFAEAIGKLKDEIERISTKGAREIGPSLLMAPEPETQPGPADDELDD
jgi:hypothetical protein